MKSIYFNIWVKCTYSHASNAVLSWVLWENTSQTVEFCKICYAYIMSIYTKIISIGHQTRIREREMLLNTFDKIHSQNELNILLFLGLLRYEEHIMSEFSYIWEKPLIYTNIFYPFFLMPNNVYKGSGYISFRLWMLLVF